MAAAALDHHLGPATRTLHLPRGSLRPPIESWGQSDECCRVCDADKHYSRDDRPLYKVASPRVAASRGPQGWIALCTEHGADPRIHAPVRAARHLPAADHSVTLAYRLSHAEPCPVRKHVVVVYGNVWIFDTRAEADLKFARVLTENRGRPRRGRPARSRALRFDILVPDGISGGSWSLPERFARCVARSFIPGSVCLPKSDRDEFGPTPTPEA